MLAVKLDKSPDIQQDIPTISENRMSLLRVGLKLKNGNIVVDEVRRLVGKRPPGEIKQNEEVPASVIGHWVEISSAQGEIIYRRYIQTSLPFNVENASSKLQRIYSLERYHILVPDLAEGTMLTLFEQSLPSEKSKKLERKIRLSLGLVPTAVKLAQPH